MNVETRQDVPGYIVVKTIREPATTTLDMRQPHRTRENLVRFLTPDLLMRRKMDAVKPPSDYTAIGLNHNSPN